MGKQFYAIFKVGRREKLAQNYGEERFTLLLLPACSVKVGFRVQSVIISLSLSLGKGLRPPGLAGSLRSFKGYLHRFHLGRSAETAIFVQIKNNNILLPYAVVRLDNSRGF